MPSHPGSSVVALLPAAGKGTRMGGALKQFRALGGRPLFCQTARVFDAHPLIREVIVIGPPSVVGEMSMLVGDDPQLQNVRVVPGGATRSESVRAGLDATKADDEIVIVHDAVRPFVTAGQIEAVIAAARLHEASSLALRVVDSLRRVREGVFSESIDRSEVFRVQTPQAFTRALLARALSAPARLQTATDDASLVMALGHRVHMVEGDSINFKVTTEEDWRLATLLWPAWTALKEEST